MKDKKIQNLIKSEEVRQSHELQLIPSENYTSSDVLNALGSVFTNKYSEGYIGKRYYQGNKYVDKVEQLAVDRAKKLFNCKYANVQPLSGSPANLAVYMALLKPGDKILSMNLASGGHLSHGSPVNIVSSLYSVHFYNVSKTTQKLNYKQILKIAKKVKPQLIIAGASAYPQIIDFKKFKQIATEVNAYLMADIAHIAGLVAANLHPSPVGVADVITTTTHKTLRGPRGGLIMTNNEEIFAKVQKSVFPGGVQAGPHNNVHAAKAVAFYEALQPSFLKYQNQVIKNAAALAIALKGYGFNLVSGGTKNHLLLIDLTNKGLDGKDCAIALEEAGIIVNYNMIPFDTKTPFRPIGIRLGTPAVTSRGMVEDDMVQIAKFINDAVNNYKDKKKLSTIKKQVKNFASKYKVPGIN